MPGAKASIRRAHTQLVFLFAAPALMAQTVASADRCNELRAIQQAAMQELAAATAVGRDFARMTRLEGLQREALKQHRLLVELRENRRGNLIAELLGDEAPRADKLRDFAARAGLPSEVQALIAANRPEEFWRRAQLETRRQYNELLEQPQFREDAARTEAARQREEQAWNALYLAGCLRSGPVAPAAGPPATAEGPLPVPLHPAGDRPWSETPILSDGVITRWTAAHRAAMAGGGAPWEKGRMTQLEYLAITGRMRDFSSVACTQSRQREVTRVICRITAANPASLGRYFSPEEIAALAVRQDDVGSALSTPGS